MMMRPTTWMALGLLFVAAISSRAEEADMPEMTTY